MIIYLVDKFEPIYNLIVVSLNFTACIALLLNTEKLFRSLQS